MGAVLYLLLPWSCHSISSQMPLRRQPFSPMIPSRNTTRVPKLGLAVARARVERMTAEGEHVQAKGPSKVVLVLIEISALGFLGADRFYMGNTALGCMKFLVTVTTCGVGGALWGFLDFVVVLLNALQMRESIDILGFHGTFSD